MSVQSLDDLAHAIDTASDAWDEISLRRLDDECANRLSAVEGEDRVRLLYYRSNTFASIAALKTCDPEYTWGCGSLTETQSAMVSHIEHLKQGRMSIVKLKAILHHIGPGHAHLFQGCPFLSWS